MLKLFWLAGAIWITIFSHPFRLLQSSFDALLIDIFKKGCSYNSPYFPGTLELMGIGRHSIFHRL
jgi:hypothetical protein